MRKRWQSWSQTMEGHEWAAEEHMLLVGTGCYWKAARKARWGRMQTIETDRENGGGKTRYDTTTIGEGRGGGESRLSRKERNEWEIQQGDCQWDFGLMRWGQRGRRGMRRKDQSSPWGFQLEWMRDDSSVSCSKPTGLYITMHSSHT